MQGSDPLAVRAGKRLRNDELLITAYGGLRLRQDLDRYLWRDRDHITLRQLWDYCTQYL